MAGQPIAQNDLEIDHRQVLTLLGRQKLALPLGLFQQRFRPVMCQRVRVLALADDYGCGDGGRWDLVIVCNEFELIQQSAQTVFLCLAEMLGKV